MSTPWVDPFVQTCPLGHHILASLDSKHGALVPVPLSPSPCELDALAGLMCPGRTLSAASPARRESELSAAVMPPPRAGCAAAADALRRLRGAACISEHTRSHGAPLSRSSIANPSAYSRLFLLSCTIPRARTVQHKAHTARFPIYTAIHWYWQFRSLLPTQSTCAAELKSAWSLCHSSASKHAKDVHATVL